MTATRTRGTRPADASASTAAPASTATPESTAPTPAPSNPCQEKLDRLGWVMGDVYRVHGVSVQIRTTSPGFGRWMDRALDAHRATGDPEARFSVAIGDEGPASTSIHTLYRGIVPLVRSRRVSTLARTLLDELEAFSYPRRDDAVFVYATLVELEGLNVLIPSYLAPYLSRSRRLIEARGIRMSTGPAVAVDPRTGRLRSAPTHLDLPRGAAGHFSSAEPSPPEVVRIDRSLGVDAVCWFDRAVEDAVRPVSRARALYTLASDTANLETMAGTALEALGRLVRDAECLEIRGDTPRAMLSALVDAVRG